MSLSADEIRELYQRTEILRKPRHGIISGYHELPYVCLGAAHESPWDTTVVRGKVQVSPRFIIRPQHLGPSYAEIFGEDNVDIELAGRMFGFLGFRGAPVECKSEHIEVRHRHAVLERVTEKIIEELHQQEDITTGVIVTPDSRYYPVSIERFISSILEDEFHA